MSKRENVTNPKPMKGDLNIDETNVITGVYKHSKDYNPYLVYPISIQKFNRDSKKGVEKLHPTQKPILLIELLVKTYSNSGDTILDNTFGSCTTRIACINTNRNFIGIENNMEYFNTSLKRMEEKRKEKDFNLITSFGYGM